MAVLGISTRKGDPKELLVKYDQVFERMSDLSPAPGTIAHYCVAMDDGIMVINVSESEEQLRAAGQREEFRKAVQEVFGEGTPIVPEIYQVHNMRHA